METTDSARLIPPPRWPVTHSLAQIVQQFWDLPEEIITDHSATVGGRAVLRRGQGKISFVDLSNQEGALQVVARVDGTEDYELWKEHVRLGSMLGVTGLVGTTKSGQVSIFVQEWQILSYFQGAAWPSHVIDDPEVKYRDRVLHLISSLPTAAQYLQVVKRYHSVYEE